MDVTYTHYKRMGDKTDYRG